MKFNTLVSSKSQAKSEVYSVASHVIVNFFEWRIILGFFARREGKILMIPHISNAGNFLLPIILQITMFLYYSKWNILSHECMSFSAKIQILNFEFFTSIFDVQLFWNLLNCQDFSQFLRIILVRIVLRNINCTLAVIY